MRLNTDKRTITQDQLDIVLRDTIDKSTSKLKEPRIIAKIKKVYVEYPKIYVRLLNEAAQKRRCIHAS